MFFCFYFIQIKRKRFCFSIYLSPEPSQGVAAQPLTCAGKNELTRLYKVARSLHGMTRSLLYT